VPVVEVEVAAGDAELAADALWQAGPSAVSEEAAGPGRVRLVADVQDLARVDRRWAPRVIEPDTEAHLRAWRAFARPHRAGRRLLIVPAWLDAGPPTAGEVVVRVDPGTAFGSGSHPSTRLVLGVLEDELRAGDRVLDAGCGSGVLAVAARLLGAGPVTAVDIDQGAVDATVGNALRNGVADGIRADAIPLEAVAGRFEVVLANIGAAVLAAASGALRAAVAPGGLLVLAGVLDAQVDDVVRAFPGCREVRRESLEGWAVVGLRCEELTPRRRLRPPGRRA
jgi:ribosomal protein L11 methyltransferase